jgi:hypothetical protein
LYRLDLRNRDNISHVSAPSSFSGIITTGCA